jgi:hypothetical protein
VKRSFLALTLGAVAACSYAASAPPAERAASFRGVYSATAEGGVGDIAFDDDGGYVLRARDCHSTSCLEAGTAAFDARAKTLTLGARTLRVEIVAKSKTSSPGALRPRDLVERDGGLVDEAGVQLTETVIEATLDGQPVQLVEQPAWPGMMPGTAPLRSPADGEVFTSHPGGHSVTVARPGDPAFAADPALARMYAGRANIYNAHGMPGTIYGGIPEPQVRTFLNDSTDPLIVATCFGGTAMTGGSAIRRLVSAYGNDPAVASRVYGCTGWTIANTDVGFACTGAWVDANQQAVPLVDRQRLGLIQMRCGSNTITDRRPSWDDCHDPH